MLRAWRDIARSDMRPPCHYRGACVRHIRAQIVAMLLPHMQPHRWQGDMTLT